MSYRLLIALSAAACVLLLVVLWIGHEQAPEREDIAAGPVLEGLSGALADVRMLRLVGAGERTLVGFSRGAHGWGVDQREGWPADAVRLRELLIMLGEARRLDPRTARPERYAQLGVEDVAAADAGGLRIDVETRRRQWQLIVGRVGGQGVGSVVRVPGEAQSWLTDQVLQPQRSPERWLLRDLFDLSSRRVVEIALVPPEGGAVHARRDAQGEWALVDPPEGRRLSSPAALESLAGTLDFLQLEDVERASGDEEEEPALRATFRSVEGLLVTLAGDLRGERLWVRFAAKLEEAVAVEWAEAEAERDRRALAAAGEPAVGSGPERDEMAPDQAGPAAFEAPPLRSAEERLAELRREVERINALTAGWHFALPNFKAFPLRRGLEEYLVDE